MTEIKSRNIFRSISLIIEHWVIIHFLRRDYFLEWKLSTFGAHYPMHSVALLLEALSDFLKEATVVDLRRRVGPFLGDAAGGQAGQSEHGHQRRLQGALGHGGRPVREALAPRGEQQRREVRGGPRRFISLTVAGKHLRLPQTRTPSEKNPLTDSRGVCERTQRGRIDR